MMSDRKLYDIPNLGAQYRKVICLKPLLERGTDYDSYK